LGGEGQTEKLVKKFEEDASAEYVFINEAP